MSRILGQWNADGAPADREMLSRMAATMQYPNHEPTAVRTGGHWGLGSNLLRVTPESQAEVQPFVGKNGITIVFDGRLDNRDELFELVATDLDRSIPDSELVVALFGEKAERAFTKLNGEFAFAIADVPKQRLLLARDICGSRPLYYTQRKDAHLFASEVKALLACPDVDFVPDEEVLAWFLLRYPATDLRGRTFFRDVLSVRPGWFIEISASGVKSREFWDYDRSKRIRFSSFEEYGEAFREVFVQAVERRMRSAYPVSLCVSGGLDSSAVLCVANASPGRERLRPITHTFVPGTAADEESFVDELEKHCGIMVERFKTPLGFEANMEAAMLRSEVPILEDMADCQKELYSRIGRNGSRSFMTGLFGDQVLFDYSYLVSLILSGNWSLAAGHLRGFADWYPDVGYEYYRREVLRATLRSMVPNSLLNALRKYRSHSGISRRHAWLYSGKLRQTEVKLSCDRLPVREFASRHARSLYYIAHSAAYLIQIELSNKHAAAFGLENSTPFLDREVIQFLMAIPGEVANSEGVPKAILREAAGPFMPPALAKRRAKADGTAFANNGMENAFPRLVQLIAKDGQVLSRGYLETKVISQLQDLQGRINGVDCQSTFELSEFFGLELWLRCFNQHKRAPERPSAHPELQNR